MTSPQRDAVSASYWQSLVLAADSGDLHLDADTARRCDAACEAFLARLDTHIKRAALLADADGYGYGSFASGISLANAFASKAVGAENSLVEVLESHVQVVKEMQVVFRKFLVDYQDTEHNNSTAIGQAGSN